MTGAEWDDVVNTNLKGPYFLAQAYAAHCIARKRPGCIVNIASTHGMTGFAGRAVYGITKGGLIQMTRMLAIEWIGHNIRVNSVAPSTVLTPSRAKMYDDATRARMLARIPTGRFITPEEVAAAVIFLASPGASSITGQTLGRRRRFHGELARGIVADAVRHSPWSALSGGNTVSSDVPADCRRPYWYTPCPIPAVHVVNARPERPERKRALRPNRLRHHSKGA